MKPVDEQKLNIVFNSSSAGKLSNEQIEALVSCGIISGSGSDAKKHIDMINKKKMVLEVHDTPITQGKGKDKRFSTYVFDETCKGNRRRVFKTAENDMYEYLYNYYFSDNEKKQLSMINVHPRWLRYRIQTCNRKSTIYRQDSDWKKYYLNEPLSQEIINKPLNKLKRTEIKAWACQIIKKYKLTSSAWGNIKSIMNQIYEYLNDSEELDYNPLKTLNIDSRLFRKTAKKPAATQIFYAEEIIQIIAESYKRAANTLDAAYLSIILFFYTGLRIGEILGLSYSDFNKDNSSVYIHAAFCQDTDLQDDGTWTTREWKVEDFLKQNKDPHDILVPDDVFTVVDLIHSMESNKSFKDDYLFHVKTPQNIEYKLYRICDELDLFRRSPHKCRKTYISTLLNNGVDPDFVREQVAHSDLKTTYKYYTFSTTKTEDKIKQLNNILGA